MDYNQIMLGKYSLPFILSIILSIIYKRVKVGDDLKSVVSVACGVAVGVVAMFYNNAYADINFVMIADYILAGGMAGSAAIGIYEINKAAPTGKSYFALDSNNKRIPGAKVVKVHKSKVVG